MASRYFPFSQEFNSDGEGWELTDTFGDRSVRIWIEILAILDRERNNWKQVEGWDSVISRKVRQSPATVQRVVGWMLAKQWLRVRQPSTDSSPLVLYSPNFAKYRKTAAEPKPSPNPPNPPNLTNLDKNQDLFPTPKKTKGPMGENFCVTDEHREWAKSKGYRSPDLLFEAFKDHHLKEGSKFLDWDAALRTWVRNDTERFGVKTGEPQREGELSERTKRILRRGL